MTRQEHLDWCKKNALEYCNRGDTRNALISMFSDLKKHSETAEHPGIKIGILLLTIGSLSNETEARNFIEGSN